MRPAKAPERPALATTIRVSMMSRKAPIKQETPMPRVRHLYLAEGRTVEQKKKLMQALSAAVVDTLVAASTR